jgi:dihydroxyacetone kinase-like protein
VTDAGTIRRWLVLSADALHANREELTRLDSPIGDADHGANMDRGFIAVRERLAELDDAPPGKLLTTAGSTLVSKVGGASGPLWGTALRRAGRSLGDEQDISDAALVSALEAAVAGVKELGGAEPGDATMIDALEPAVTALQQGLLDGAGLTAALERASDAAQAGSEATIPLQARKGRASYLGERSIGHKDPGSASAALIVGALAEAVAGS